MAIGLLVREVDTTRKGVTSTALETAYFLLSEKLTPARFAEVVRAHWGIENRLHWVLDVVMDEDRARNRADNGPENLAVLRHLTLNLLNDDGTRIGMKRKFKKAASNPSYLGKLLAAV